MLNITYHRTEANVDDYRRFRNEAEFEDWYKRQEELEHVIITAKWTDEEAREWFGF